MQGIRRMMGSAVTNVVVAIALIAFFGGSSAQRIAWGYECRSSRCVKVQLDEKTEAKALSLDVCRMFCGDVPSTLWPKPNGLVKMEPMMARITPGAVKFNIFNNSDTNGEFWTANEERFAQQIDAKVPKRVKLTDEGSRLMIMVDVKDHNAKLNHETNEAYRIEAYENTGVVLIKIKAETRFGARHALETLSQLIVYDNIRQELQIVGEFVIEDKPVFKHRGFLLDTSRNYFSVDTIKRTIDGMAMVKLNTFHWHITDSQSFPIVLKSHPDLSRLGAYSPDKIYTPEDVAEIYQYAYVRGVIVLPEFDAPAHVGEGWQGKNVTTCFNAKPWTSYCVEPPCGQLDPTKDALYDILEDIYREYYGYFRNPDVFHMGGDEVNFACWNSSSEIQDFMKERGWGLAEADFMKLWNHFQSNALERLDKVVKRKVPIIMWTSHLTQVPYLEQYLDKSRYVIQIWTTGADKQITDLLERGYSIIMSNYDALYLDCGFGAWVTEGNNWCSPYIGWEKVYKNNITNFDWKYRDQIIGAEAAIWSEQIDDQTVDGRTWPRLSALAERLWSNPTTSWRDAESRMLMHRERLVQNKIAAESLQPQWCLQNEDQCPI